MANKDKPFSSELLLWGDLREGALRAKETYGRTDRHSTGIKSLDDYLYGGFGRTDNWEVFVIHGAYKVGKSTIGLNMLRGAIEDGTKVGLFILEDDLDTTAYRLALAMDDPEMLDKRLNDGTVRFLPRKKKGRNRWSLEEMLQELEKWFTDPVYGVEIIFLDHLQFMFDNAETNHDYGQWAAQNTFMHDLNDLMDRVKKTIVIISQENRDKQIAGSIGVPRAATKMVGIDVVKGEPTVRLIQLEPGRNTPSRETPFRVEILNTRMYPDALQNGGVQGGF